MLYFFIRIGAFFRSLWHVWTQKEASTAASLDGLKLLELKSHANFRRDADSSLVEKLTDLVTWTNFFSQANYEKELDEILKDNEKKLFSTLGIAFKKGCKKEDYQNLDLLKSELEQLIKAVISSYEKLKGLTLLKAALLSFVPVFVDTKTIKEEIDKAVKKRSESLEVVTEALSEVITVTTEASKEVIGVATKLAKKGADSAKKVANSLVAPTLPEAATEKLKGAHQSFSNVKIRGGVNNDDGASLSTRGRVPRSESGLVGGGPVTNKQKTHDDAAASKDRKNSKVVKKMGKSLSSLFKQCNEAQNGGPDAPAQNGSVFDAGRTNRRA